MCGWIVDGFLPNWVISHDTANVVLKLSIIQSRNEGENKLKMFNFLSSRNLVWSWSWSYYEIPFRSSLMQKRGNFMKNDSTKNRSFSISYQWQGRRDFLRCLFSEINIHSHSFITCLVENMSNHQIQIRCESFNFLSSLRPELFHFSHFHFPSEKHYIPFEYFFFIYNFQP